jgi:ABC-type multidrug transport system fused ATPase/permease subunit
MAASRPLQYVRLWCAMLALSWRHRPIAASLTFAGRMLGVITFIAIGIAFRASIDAGQSHSATESAVASVILAFAFAADWVLSTACTNLRMLMVEQLGVEVVEPTILRVVAELEALDHLERAENLDRVTALRGAGWKIVDSAWGLVESLFNALRLGCSVLLLGSISPWLALLLGLAAVPLWTDARGRRATRAVETAVADSMRLQRHLFAILTTAGSGKEVRLSGSTASLVDAQISAWNEANSQRYTALVRAALWKSAGWLVFAAGFAAGLAVVVEQAIDGRAGVGDIVLSITIATNLRGALRQTVVRTAQTAGHQQVIEPYLWLRRYAAEQDVRKAACLRRPPERLVQGITLQDVTYAYQDAVRPAVEAVSVQIPAGAVVAIVGEFGSGKSTLLNLLCKFHEPASGAIALDGIDLAEIDTRQWWNEIASVFQDFGRYATSFKEAVGLGDLARISDVSTVTAAIVQAEADVVVDRLPQGLETELGSPFGGTELSEGQWQKTALARSHMRQDPLLFVLDEPTASLDAPSERAIFDRFIAHARSRGAERGSIAVIVSHRFSTVAGADLILVMDQGKLVEAGNHEQLIAANSQYAELYGIAASSYSSAIS